MQRTRQRILHAAQILFSTKGFETVSIRDIAATAELSHPAIAKHFSDKKAILQALATQATEGANLSHPMLDEGEKLQMYVVFLAAALRESSSGKKIFFSCLHERTWDVVGDRSAQCHMLLSAARLGLIVLSRYLPELDVAELLATRLGNNDISRSKPSKETQPVNLASILPPTVGGYARGRDRRKLIVEKAAELFAEKGYNTTSLRDIASEVGVGASTLLHYFGSKENLLSAVLLKRDADLVAKRAEAQVEASAELENLGSDARDDARTEPGLIELYSVLCAEAVFKEHPAHIYFKLRFERTISYFESLIARGGRSNVDPRFEAVWLVALWDGLQYFSLCGEYDGDIGDLLDVHLTRHVLKH
ncbi:HTH-type transcriptional regulator BetI [compost metagenome]